MATCKFSPRGSRTGGGLAILEIGVDEIVGFEVGRDASDWRPAATVELVTDAAVLTEIAAAVTVGGEIGVCRPAFCVSETTVEICGVPAAEPDVPLCSNSLKRIG